MKDLEEKNSGPVQHEPDYVRTSDAPLEKKKEALGIPLPLKIIGLLFVVVVASVAYWQSQLRNDPTLTEEPMDAVADEQRTEVPDVQFSTRDGKLARLSDYKGKVVLLSFWAQWCAPCLVELPSFKGLAEKYADKGLVILPINLDEKGQADEQIDKIWAAEQFPFPTYYDFNKMAAKTFNVDTLPANYVVDKRGRLVFSSIGSNDWASSTSQELFSSLLTENP